MLTEEQSRVVDKRKRQELLIPLADRFQIAAFHAHFKINKQAGDNNHEAFGKAIAATSNQATARALERDPQAIERWVAAKKERQGA